jgi:hypothetical protein
VASVLGRRCCGWLDCALEHSFCFLPGRLSCCCWCCGGCWLRMQNQQSSFRRVADYCLREARLRTAGAAHIHTAEAAAAGHIHTVAEGESVGIQDCMVVAGRVMAGSRTVVVVVVYMMGQQRSRRDSLLYARRTIVLLRGTIVLWRIALLWRRSAVILLAAVVLLPGIVRHAPVLLGL